MQRKATIWILRPFHTSPTLGIEAIARLIPIHLHLHKLSSRSQLRAHSLPSNHILKSLLKVRHSNNHEVHWLLLERLTPRLYLNIKDSVVDMNNRTNEIFSSFDLFNKEFSLEDRLIDIFSSCFFFHSTARKSKESLKMHIHKLDNITLQVSADPKSVVIVSDASIKNQVATLIAHIHIHDSPIIKMIYYAINITSTEAELFAIKCSINQVTCLPTISQIIIVTNSIHAVKRIFNSSSYPF